MKGGDRWCFLAWTQEDPTGRGTPDCHIFPVLASGPFVPGLSSCRAAHQVPPLLHSRPKRRDAYKIQLNEATQAPEQENLAALQRTPAWVSRSSSFEPLFVDQPPQGLPLPEPSGSSRKGAGRTEPITIYPGESWKLQASLGALAVVWICTETVCGTWSPPEEGNTACSRGTQAQSRSLSQPTHLWAEES